MSSGLPVPPSHSTYMLLSPSQNGWVCHGLCREHCARLRTPCNLAEYDSRQPAALCASCQSVTNSAGNQNRMPDAKVETSWCTMLLAINTAYLFKQFSILASRPIIKDQVGTVKSTRAWKRPQPKP